MESTDGPVGDKAAGALDEHRHSRVTGLGITMLVLLVLVLFLAVDYSDLIFSRSRREAALDLIRPGMRLTQAERELNSAGYLTLYIDETPPVLQVSSLSRVPFTAKIVHSVIPHSTPDVWLRSKLSSFTRFYIIAQLDGTVKFTPDGRAATFAGPEVLL